MTFGEYWPTYKAKKRGFVKETTLAAYALHWNHHLKSFFEDMDIDSVKSSTFQKFIDGQIARGVGVKITRDCVVVVKNMIKLWCLDNDLPIYSFTIIWPTAASQQQEKREKYTDKEIKALVDYCKESPAHRDKVIALGVMTGTRIGELCGFKYGDFDFSEGTISVKRTVGRLYDGEGKTELYINRPKCCASERRIPIPVWLKNYFRDYQKLFKLDDDEYISKEPNSCMPFCEPRSFRVYFIRICEKIGIPYRSFHSLRHSYASRLLAAKVDIRTTAELLGHSDVQTTLNIYAHSDDDAKKAAAKKIFL